MEVHVDTNNMDKWLIASEPQLNSYVEKVSHYFTEENTAVLKRLISLEDSVFWHEEFGKIFGECQFFKEIAKYNICNRLIRLLNTISFPNQNGRFNVRMHNGITVFYQSFDEKGQLLFSLKLFSSLMGIKIGEKKNNEKIEIYLQCSNVPIARTQIDTSFYPVIADTFYERLITDCNLHFGEKVFSRSEIDMNWCQIIKYDTIITR